MKIVGNILAFNSGSSSLKFQICAGDVEASTSLLRGTVRDFGDEAYCEWYYLDKHWQTPVTATNHAEAAKHVIKLLGQITDTGRLLIDSIAAMGLRIVHGGENYFEPTLLTEEVLTELEKLSSLAPLHNPSALAVVRACQNQLRHIPMVGVFDTAFFHTLPDYVRTYALPSEWREQPQPVRRYGFHGLAHRYMVERCLAMQDTNVVSSKVITLQLGHGCSIAAIRNGKAIETSMGFTPLEGLIMATRPGDLDAGVVLHLLKHDAINADALYDGLNHRAGLLGMSGASADMRELLELEAQGHAGAHIAIKAFCHRVRKYLGAYLAVLGGADAIVFGGGIGEHAGSIRTRICAGMDWCGLQLDEQVNRSAIETELRISTAESTLAAYVIPVNEEILIAHDVKQCLNAV